MHSVVSRPQPLAPTSSNRVPRKSTSFMSLRREKSKNVSVSPQPDPSGSRSYFDAYPRLAPARASKPKAHASSSPPGSPNEIDSPVSFPPIQSSSGGHHPPESSRNPLHRSRSYTVTSRDGRGWREPGRVPALRFSGSSTQHTDETPPDTPIDYGDGESFTGFPAVVSAPVFGVEMMDALVDGMNGGDDFMGRPSSRQRFGIPNRHPLYEPPLPTPPPGIVLGGPKAKQRRQRQVSLSSESDSGEDTARRQVTTASRPRKRAPRPGPTRSDSKATITPEVEEDPPLLGVLSRKSSAASIDRHGPVAPSISDIIRIHAPLGQIRSRTSMSGRSSAFSHGHAPSILQEETEPEAINLDDDGDIVSRSSVDSIAEEVRQTLRTQLNMKPTNPRPTITLPPPSSFNSRRHSTLSDSVSVYSPRSEGGASSSLYAPSIRSNPQSVSPVEPGFLSFAQPSASQAVAQYLRSVRLTTLLKLTRSPHASQDNPLTVSLSDLGSPTGFPVVVFLGLGCVRHVMGLYDDMAQCLGLRLITIDRWGLGRTESRSRTAKGIMQWASAVEEVLDLLQIPECSIMAHSAGTPYALSFANKVPTRIRGDICLMAPWVGGSENGGYKWLKYVPNGILKTAQAAEWKVQAWMLGKPPTIAYEGIGYTVAPKAQTTSGNGNSLAVQSSAADGEARPRPSIGSSFSEYDDLGDFDGRFESKSTLAVAAAARPAPDAVQTAKRKPSRGFLNRFKPSQPASPQEETAKPKQRLKALRSMGSLRGRASSYNNSSKHSGPSEPSSPVLPPAPKFDFGMGMDDLHWPKSGSSEVSLIGEGVGSRAASERFYASASRTEGRRSLSFNSAGGTAPSWPLSTPSSPAASTRNTSSTSVFLASDQPTNEYQSTLGNALIAASHAESAKGTYSDLLQILNHDNHPWGFSYTNYPHSVNVWYGDKDEKIGENAVRWMEKNMGADKCIVKVVNGGDHALMYNSGVVIEVLEQLLGYWQSDQRRR
ncbi:unnamed protein product [Mycena citricolor]|uniref:Alpha/beta-hydrolase n=1 Tax=Mycena citricolor TaxID=2018698 RepID=A0AAD2GYA6_9AGAR|nr:unnamed protein product [Mycena citricolor]